MSKTLWKPYVFSYSKNITSDVYIADDTCYLSIEQMHFLLDIDEKRIIEVMDSGFTSKEHKSLHSIYVNKSNGTKLLYDLNSLRYVCEKLDKMDVYFRLSDWAYDKHNSESLITCMLLVQIVLAIPLISLLNCFVVNKINLFLAFAVIFAFFSPFFLLLLNDIFLFFVITSLIAGAGYTLCAGYLASVAFLFSFGFLVWGSFAERPYGFYFKKPIQYGYNALRAYIWNSLKNLE